MTRADDVFGADYAGLYDLFYKDKDYKLECDTVQLAANRYSPRPCSRILDLGCGTGGHVFELASRGFQVDGVDLSQAMLSVADAKLQSLLRIGTAPPISFRHGDLRTVDLGGQYDLAIMMFAVLGYQTSNAAVLEALRNVHRHLRANGVLIFDVWYGPAVLSTRPERRTRDFTRDGTRLTRVASAELDTYCHTAKVLFRIGAAEERAATTEFSEAHTMRYFFPQELALFLDCAGFSLRSITTAPSLDTPVNDTTWNALVVAQAC